MRRITKTFVGIGIAGIIYMLSSHHIIYFGGKTFKVLKKQKLTLNYTFFSATLKSNKSILSIDILREAGIADLLIGMGRMNEAQRDRLMSEYEDDGY